MFVDSSSLAALKREGEFSFQYPADGQVGSTGTWSVLYHVERSMLVGKGATGILSSGVEGETGEGEREADVVREGEDEDMVDVEREVRPSARMISLARSTLVNTAAVLLSAPQFSPKTPKETLCLNRFNLPGYVSCFAVSLPIVYFHPIPGLLPRIRKTDNIHDCPCYRPTTTHRLLTESQVPSTVVAKKPAYLLRCCVSHCCQR